MMCPGLIVNRLLETIRDYQDGKEGGEKQA
jgi:hypothetical protein